jgi:hypothetical protein
VSLGELATRGRQPARRARQPSPALRPLVAPAGEHPSVCPHCWMVNPGEFRLCARCGASMESFLQESAGLRRTAAVQSPVPVTGRLTLGQRFVVGLFLVLRALAFLGQLLPRAPAAAAQRAPASGAP